MHNSRRNFIKTSSLIAASTITFPNLLARNLNSKLNIALIGVGGRGIQNWQPIIILKILLPCVMWTITGHTRR